MDWRRHQILEMEIRGSTLMESLKGGSSRNILPIEITSSYVYFSQHLSSHFPLAPLSRWNSISWGGYLAGQQLCEPVIGSIL